jgi:predicted lipid-binding transport protein (Tim44 family)
MEPAAGIAILILLAAAAAWLLSRGFTAPPVVESAEPDAASHGPSHGPAALSPAEVEPFLRTAKNSFIRLHAADDSRDLADIRDYTTPEVYAEMATRITERGDAPHKTEVVMLDAQLVDDVIEDDAALASVHFSGLIRENDAPTPSPFDEIWHVRKNLRERNATWQIAGIQLAA